MEIVNRTPVQDALVRDVARRSLVSGESFIVFLGGAVNALRADSARTKLQEYRQKGWIPLAGWQEDETGETDIHACTVSRRIIASQKLPSYVIEAIGGYDLLVYLDAMWTQASQMGFSLTLAHELRHAWQYFNAPLVFHSQTPLAWVIPPQLTPCELDAEKSAKRVLGQIYGDESVHAYFNVELARCKPEHREFMERLAALDPAADPQVEAQTIALLEQHGAEIRELQIENSFMMPGIPELSAALRGRSDVRLRP